MHTKNKQKNYPWQIFTFAALGHKIRSYKILVFLTADSLPCLAAMKRRTTNILAHTQFCNK